MKDMETTKIRNFNSKPSLNNKPKMQPSKPETKLHQ